MKKYFLIGLFFWGCLNNESPVENPLQPGLYNPDPPSTQLDFGMCHYDTIIIAEPNLFIKIVKVAGEIYPTFKDTLKFKFVNDTLNLKHVTKYWGPIDTNYFKAPMYYGFNGAAFMYFAESCDSTIVKYKKVLN